MSCFRGHKDCAVWKDADTVLKDRCQICGEHLCRDKDGYNIGEDGGAEFWVDAGDMRTTHNNIDVFFLNREIPGALDSLGSYNGYGITAHGDCGFGQDLELA